MSDLSPPPSPRTINYRRVASLLAVSLVSVVVWAVWPRLRSIVGPGEKTPNKSVRLRDVYAGSPFQNTRPGVGYVGDAACARCHREISEAYRSHPMGRSLAPIGGTKDGPPASGIAGLPVGEKGVHYTIEHRSGRVFHKATRRDADGVLLAEIEGEVRFALGSGTRGIGYLIDREGYLFQSPISWYTQQQRWDISPGYGEFTKQANFERPIQPDCLFCHANQFRAVAGSVNHYETPIFQGHAIGCERCHGPGELHVSRDALSTESDLTIVNPASLAPALRDSVCEQCHLQGRFRFARAGRTLFDYRPGLPIHRFLAVFLMKNGRRGNFEAVGHAEQMAESRCFAASKGQLGCISCHDPHRVPARAAKVAYYRERCLECHAKKGCALPIAQRQSQGQAGDCIACHMPRPTVTNVPHTAATDHRILRSAPGSVSDDSPKTTGQPGESPLFDFHWPLMTADEQRDAARDMGMAMGWAARNLKASPRIAKLAATQGLPLLEVAVRDRPDDLPAREFLGDALEAMDRPEDALHAFEDVLRGEPGREWALHSSGRLLTRLQRFDLARSAWQKTIAVDPWQSIHRLKLADNCYRAGDWRGGVAACREAIRLNPELFEARSLLIQCYLRGREFERAHAELEILLRFYPASRDDWQNWYEQQKQASPVGVGAATTDPP